MMLGWMSDKTLYLNGNNQTLNIQYSVGNVNGGTATFSNININARSLSVDRYTNIIIYNSTINTSSMIDLVGEGEFYNTTLITNNFGNHELMIVDDYSTIEAQSFRGQGKIMSNQTIGDYENIIPKDYTFINTTIDTPMYFNGNTMIINSTITATLKNEGNLTIINSTLSNVESSGNSNTNALFIDNYGNLTMTGCVMENNSGNLTLKTGFMFSIF